MITNKPSEDLVRQLAQHLLDMGFNKIPPREKRVIEQVARRLAVSRNINRDFDKDLTFGQRLADKVAAFGGSWTFIIGFGCVLAAWIGLNSFLLPAIGNPGFDAYPYIFLNLILSMLAAVQAPLIMMSQNRQAAKDRLTAAHDYEVNLKAELEIMTLHDKLDQIRSQELAILIRHLGIQPDGE